MRLFRFLGILLYNENLYTGGDMHRKVISVCVIITFMTVLAGCASVPEEHKGAATGAGIGAAAGAVAGALSGSEGAKTEMAVVGGFLGALAGGVIGHYAYDKKNTGDETSKKYKYQSSKGIFIRIETAATVPAKVKAGETVELRMTYAVLGAKPNKELLITETREIRYGGEIFGKPIVHVNREDGTYSSSIPVTLPPDAKKGKYTVMVTVKVQNKSASKETAFFVN